MAINGTYSFQDVQCAFVGPTGSFALGTDGGAAEEGITISMLNDKSTMTTGADGDGMHSLHAAKSGTVTVRLLKTSPVNQKLSLAYIAETAASALFGQDLISLRNSQTGDTITCRQCAFKKLPDNTNSVDGGTMEWVFNAISIDQILGSGSPAR
jgi:hypothetical protein